MQVRRRTIEGDQTHMSLILGKLWYFEPAFFEGPDSSFIEKGLAGFKDGPVRDYKNGIVIGDGREKIGINQRLAAIRRLCFYHKLTVQGSSRIGEGNLSRLIRLPVQADPFSPPIPKADNCACDRIQLPVYYSHNKLLCRLFHLNGEAADLHKALRFGFSLYGLYKVYAVGQRIQLDLPDLIPVFIPLLVSEPPAHVIDSCSVVFQVYERITNDRKSTRRTMHNFFGR